jgi:hypothetical protein
MAPQRTFAFFETAIDLGRLWRRSTLHTIFRIAMPMFEKYLTP